MIGHNENAKFSTELLLDIFLFYQRRVRKNASFRNLWIIFINSLRKGSHWDGGLGYYENEIAVVGGGKYPVSKGGYTEKLTDNGWEELPTHPE